AVSASAEARGDFAEAANASAEASYASAEATTASAEATTASAEARTGSAEAGSASAEATTASAEAGSASAEGSYASTEATTASAEAKTASAEATYSSAETIQASAEAGTASAEAANASAEAANASAKRTYASAEATYTSAEATYTSAEVASAEGSYASAEATYASAEAGTASAEAVFASAEAVFASAEAATASAEAVTASAEAVTASAEATTASAEARGDFMEAANASAEATYGSAEVAGDFAKARSASAQAYGVAGGNLHGAVQAGMGCQRNNPNHSTAQYEDRSCTKELRQVLQQCIMEEDSPASRAEVLKTLIRRQCASATQDQVDQFCRWYSGRPQGQRNPSRSGRADAYAAYKTPEGRTQLFSKVWGHLKNMEPDSMEVKQLKTLLRRDSRYNHHQIKDVVEAGVQEMWAAAQARQHAANRTPDEACTTQGAAHLEAAPSEEHNRRASTVNLHMDSSLSSLSSSQPHHSADSVAGFSGHAQDQWAAPEPAEGAALEYDPAGGGGAHAYQHGGASDGQPYQTAAPPAGSHGEPARQGYPATHEAGYTHNQSVYAMQDYSEVQRGSAYGAESLPAHPNKRVYNMGPGASPPRKSPRTHDAGYGLGPAPPAFTTGMGPHLGAQAHYAQGGVPSNTFPEQPGASGGAPTHAPFMQPQPHAPTSNALLLQGRASAPLTQAFEQRSDSSFHNGHASAPPGLPQPGSQSLEGPFGMGHAATLPYTQSSTQQPVFPTGTQHPSAPPVNPQLSSERSDFGMGDGRTLWAGYQAPFPSGTTPTPTALWPGYQAPLPSGNPTAPMAPWPGYQASLPGHPPMAMAPWPGHPAPLIAKAPATQTASFSTPEGAASGEPVAQASGMAGVEGSSGPQMENASQAPLPPLPPPAAAIQGVKTVMREVQVYYKSGRVDEPPQHFSLSVRPFAPENAAPKYLALPVDQITAALQATPSLMRSLPTHMNRLAPSTPQAVGNGGLAENPVKEKGSDVEGSVDAELPEGPIRGGGGGSRDGGGPLGPLPSEATRPQAYRTKVLLRLQELQLEVCLGYIPACGTSIVQDLDTSIIELPPDLPSPIHATLSTAQQPLPPTWPIFLEVATSVGGHKTATWDCANGEGDVYMGLTPPSKADYPLLLLADCDFDNRRWGYLGSVCRTLQGLPEDALDRSDHWVLEDDWKHQVAYISFGRVVWINRPWFKEAPVSPYVVGEVNGLESYSISVSAFPVGRAVQDCADPWKQHALDKAEAQWREDYLRSSDGIRIAEYPIVADLEEEETTYKRTKPQSRADEEAQDPSQLDHAHLLSCAWKGPQPAFQVDAEDDFEEDPWKGSVEDAAVIRAVLLLVLHFVGNDPMVVKIQHLPRAPNAVARLRAWSTKDVIIMSSCVARICMAQAFQTVVRIESLIRPLRLPPALQALRENASRQEERMPMPEVVALLLDCRTDEVAGACKLYKMALRQDFFRQLPLFREERLNSAKGKGRDTSRSLAIFTFKDANQILDWTGVVKKHKAAIAGKKKAQEKAKEPARRKGAEGAAAEGVGGPAQEVTFQNSEEGTPAPKEPDQSPFEPELPPQVQGVDEYKRKEDERKRNYGRKKRKQVKDELNSLHDQLSEAQQRIAHLEERLRSSRPSQPPTSSLESEQYHQTPNATIVPTVDLPPTPPHFEVSPPLDQLSEVSERDPPVESSGAALEDPPERPLLDLTADAIAFPGAESLEWPHSNVRALLPYLPGAVTSKGVDGGNVLEAFSPPLF
ncbi:hypothetical protein EV715DRAFT_297731, partial [Schizophyllum commune]